MLAPASARYATRVFQGEAGTDLPTVVVFTHSLLEPSMTFIVSHAEALRRYTPVYAGARRVPGLDLPSDRVELANRGGLLGAAEEFSFRRLGWASGLGRRLRRFKPTLVHAHFGLSGPAGLTLAEQLNVPLIVTYHGHDATITDEEASRSWRGREYLRGRRGVMERASLIIAVSDFIRDRLLSAGFSPAKVVTHRNGIDLRYFTSRFDRPRQPVVVFVGRLIEKKGGEFLLRAMGKLRSQGKLVNTVIIGDGPLRSYLEHLAAELRVDARFTGFLPLDRVRELIGSAAVVAVPSVTASSGDSEGLPTVLLEAQAMGTPLVATRHAGNAEGCLEGRSAVLVAERDVAGLANGISNFIDDSAAVESFGRAGRLFVEANFDLMSQVEGLERLYDSARSGLVATT